MRIIRNNIIPFKGFAAINICGVLFVRNEVVITDRTLNHERIHTAQMKEMLYVFFYVIYLIEWLVRLCLRGNAYRNISFEREAYANQGDMHYLRSRKYYSWRKYLRQSSTI